MEDKKLEVVCDNLTCLDRGEYTRCYLEVGMGTYLNCPRYRYYRAFKERHDRIVTPNRKI